MRKEVGLWIDHRQAVLVLQPDHPVAIKRIASNLERHVRYSGVSHPRNGDTHLDTTEDGRDRRFEDNLYHYYDDVIAELRDASAILIMGPGEAKIEFQKRLGVHRLDGRVVGLQPADKLTDEQIAAEVRSFFRQRTPG